MQWFYAIISGQKKGLTATFCRGTLFVLSLVYGLAAIVRNKLFDWKLKKTYHSDLPVISVGNLTLGGTGKTPLVAYLVQKFLDEGKRPGIISRGYRSGENGFNDEYAELKLRFPDVPHIQNPNRIAAVKKFMKQGDADVLILDDAFQHRRIARTLDIVLIDATCPFGYGYLFPRGTLREPCAALKRADVVLLSRADLADTKTRKEIKNQVLRCNPNVDWGEIAYRPAIAEQKAKTQSTATYAVFCGIGNPEAFRTMLERSGVKIAEFTVFPDHHRYNETDLMQLEELRQNCGVEKLLCTMKDYVKIKELPRYLHRYIEPVAVDIEMLDDFRWNVYRRSVYSAIDQCETLAKSHYENFHVASLFLPKKYRQAFYVIYAYCRLADDIADDSPSPEEALEKLNDWQRQLKQCFTDNITPTVGSEHFVFTALRYIVHRYRLPKEPFFDLLRAFQQDQRKTLYATMNELLEYCRYSANPVGRIILHLIAGANSRFTVTSAHLAWSDAICTGLQLANFWQDVKRDEKIGRCYIPQEIANSYRVDLGNLRDTSLFRLMLADLVVYADQQFASGMPLTESVPPDFRRVVMLFILGGRAVLDTIKRNNYNVLVKRPRISRWKKFCLLWLSLFTTKMRV